MLQLLITWFNCDMCSLAMLRKLLQTRDFVSIVSTLQFHSPVQLPPSECFQVYESSEASAYANPAHAREIMSPKWMAITIATTEPSTLPAAFMAQAHSTGFTSRS